MKLIDEDDAKDDAADDNYFKQDGDYTHDRTYNVARVTSLSLAKQPRR